MIGEPDAGKPPVRFDEGAQETCGRVTRLCPTLPEPPTQKGGSSFSRTILPIDSATEPFLSSDCLLASNYSAHVRATNIPTSSLQYGTNAHK